MLRAGGSARKLQPRERTTLGDALADRFLRCKIGTVGASYDVDRQRLRGTVPEADGLPAWAPLMASTIVGPAIVKRTTPTRAVRDRPPVPGAGTGPEFTTVESPFIDQLADMRSNFVTGNLDEPSATGRETFREVLIKSDLRKAIERINLRDGKPWLDDARVSQVVSALERIAAPKLMEANQGGHLLRVIGLRGATLGLGLQDQVRSRGGPQRRTIDHHVDEALAELVR